MNIVSQIQKSQSICLTTHINPDADGIGSGLAFLEMIERNFPEKQVFFVIDSVIPDFLEFMPGSSQIYTPTPSKVDLLIALDCPNLDRIGSVNKKIESKTIINIDHHISNDNFGDINLVEEKSSTCEMVTNFFRENNLEISKTMAENLYTGLLTDTGGFAWNTMSSTFETAQYLNKQGADTQHISWMVFIKKSLPRMKFLGYMLNNFHVDKPTGFVYSYMDQVTLKNIGASLDDSEGVVDILKGLEGTKVCALLKEQADGKIRCSLRSNGIDVNAIASHFGGGGHKVASGFCSPLTKDEIIKKIVELLHV